MNRFTRVVTQLRAPSSRHLPKNLPISTTLTRHSPSPRSFTSTTAKMSAAKPISSETLLELVKARRTYYALNKELTISKERIEEIVKDSVLHIPTSFNSQSTRAVVLFGAEHDKLWDITLEILKGIVPAESFEPTAQRIGGFKAGAGTVLFFEDKDAVEAMQKNFPLYADKFPLFAAQSDGMSQFTVWTALEAEGLGANLQHYSPLIDSKVAETWKVPATWQLNAQLVFGGRAGEPGEKTFLPIENHVKVYGA